MSDQRERERTFIIPRRVKSEFTLAGMTRRRLILVLPWWVAGGGVYFLGSGLPTYLHMGLPVALIVLPYLLLGWPGGEDDHTAWELWRRWRQHENTPTRYLYRKEARPWN